jgi:hypothetical protein
MPESTLNNIENNDFTGQYRKQNDVKDEFGHLISCTCMISYICIALIEVL